MLKYYISSEFSSRWVLQNLMANISMNRRVKQVDVNIVISGTTSILYPKLKKNETFNSG